MLLGDQITLQNMYQGDGGFLDTKMSGCDGNMLCVSTSTSSSRDGLSGTWIVGSDGGASGTPVQVLDSIHLANQYPFDGVMGGYLDTRENACEGNKLCVSTSSSSNRASGSGTWRFER